MYPRSGAASVGLAGRKSGLLGLQLSLGFSKCTVSLGSHGYPVTATVITPDKVSALPSRLVTLPTPYSTRPRCQRSAMSCDGECPRDWALATTGDPSAAISKMTNGRIG